MLLRAAWNPFFNGKAALEAKRVEAARISQEVVEDLLERTRKVRLWGLGLCVCVCEQGQGFCIALDVWGDRGLNA